MTLFTLRAILQVKPVVEKHKILQRKNTHPGNRLLLLRSRM